jgi:hypothetical protein
MKSNNSSLYPISLSNMSILSTFLINLKGVEKDVHFDRRLLAVGRLVHRILPGLMVIKVPQQKLDCLISMVSLSILEHLIRLTLIKT